MKLIKKLAVSEDGFIFNSATGESFTTNEVGTEIINQLKNTSNKDEILKTLEEIYDTDKLSLEKNLDEFLSHLRTLNLIEDE